MSDPDISENYGSRVSVVNLVKSFTKISVKINGKICKDIAVTSARGRVSVRVNAVATAFALQGVFVWSVGDRRWRLSRWSGGLDPVDKIAPRREASAVGVVTGARSEKEEEEEEEENREESATRWLI